MVYPPALKAAATRIIEIYPRLKQETARRFGRPFYGASTVWLIDDEILFQNMIGRPYFTAFVQPETGVMVIDHTKMHLRPDTLETTLRHELCHLLLHQNIPASLLPRWLDEGLAQWGSDGISELLDDTQGDALRLSVLSERIPSFDRINHSFSLDRSSVQLAYAASRSILDYIVRQYGVEGLHRLLASLTTAETLDAAFTAALSVHMEDVESGWHDSLGKTVAWWTGAAAHLYEILFFMAAVITIVAFARLAVKKKRYVDIDESDEPDES